MGICVCVYCFGAIHSDQKAETSRELKLKLVERPGSRHVWSRLVVVTANASCSFVVVVALSVARINE